MPQLKDRNEWGECDWGQHDGPLPSVFAAAAANFHCAICGRFLLDFEGFHLGQCVDVPFNVFQYF
jgi:hypothetical protein